MYEDQRPLVYEYIINRFGKEKTGFILSSGTAVDKGTIDIIGKALRKKWARTTARKNGVQHKDKIEHDTYYYGNGKELEKDDLSLLKREIKILEESFDNPWNLSKIKKIKSEYEVNPEQTKETYSELFYYFDGIIGTKVNQSQHPAGIIASPINLIDNYGMFIGEDGQYILPINMEEIHEINLAKYDILGLKNVGIVRKTCEYAGIKYPLSHEIDWNDLDVYKDMITSPIGIFQFEGDYAFKLLKGFIELNINDPNRSPSIDSMSLVNASLRPSGESYRDRLLNGIVNKNPSKIIDDLLKDNFGYLVYQCDTIKFLQQICGLSGSEADNVRRAIGRKQIDRLQKAMPSILEGYCKVSDQPREIAEEEAKQFLQIIEDSSNYQFGFNHSTGYSMVGYLCAYMRYYYPTEFCTAYLNCANNEEDTKNGTQLLISKGIKLEKPKFGKSLSEFVCDASIKTIYKGLGSIKDVGKDTGTKLSTLYDKHYSSFFNLLSDIKKLSINSKQLDILIHLDYFSSFGHIHQLLSQVQVYADLSAIYDRLKTCKQLNKSDLASYNFTIEEVAECSTKETAKQFKELDNQALLKLFRKHYKELLAQISAKYPYAPTTIMDKLKYEVELLGYTDLVDENVNADYYIVLGIETNQWGSVFLSLYHVCTGFRKQVKANKNWWNQHKLEVGNIINVAFNYKNKRRKVDDKWVDTGEAEEIAECWSIQS